MKLYIKQKVFSWGDKFTVKGEAGRDRYYVEGEIFTFGRKLHVYDMSGREVAFIKQEVWSWMPRYYVFCGDRQVAEIKKEFTFLFPKYNIEGLGWEINGSFMAHDYEIMKQLKLEGKEPKAGCATFSGCDMNYDGEVFEGAELTAVFGGVKCDLRNAIIEKDCAIQVSAIFGGIDIFVPAGINVRVNSNSIFGGVSNKTAVHQNAPTIYVSGTCMFGGVEIK